MICCSNCADPTLYIDDEFSPKEQEMINWAIDQWEIASDSSDLLFTENKELSHTFSFNNWNDLSEIGLYRLKNTDIGLSQIYKNTDCSQDRGLAQVRGNIAVVIDNIDSDEIFKHVILHEFGHFFGIDGHTESGLMQSGSDITCIDQVSLDWMCSFEENECGRNSAPTCIDTSMQ